MTFVQTGDAPIPGRNGVLHAGITCFGCRLMGHYSDQCPTNPPNPPPVTVQLFQHGSEVAEAPIDSDKDVIVSQFTFTQFALAQAANFIPKSWILLDSQSTVSVFNNPAFLTNIRTSGTTLQAAPSPPTLLAI